MAVRFDAETLRAIVGDDRYQAAEKYLADDRVFDVTAAEGGASGAVEENGYVLDVWAGIVNGVFTGECDSDACRPGRPCPHAIAVALAGLEEGVVFSSVSASPAAQPALSPGAEQREYGRREYAGFAERLTRRQLVDLVATQAAVDRHFAATLMARARVLAAPGAAEIAAARRVIDEIQSLTGSAQWGPQDIIEVGQSLVDELSMLAIRPPTRQSLDVVEEAIGAWAALTARLEDAWPDSWAWPEETGTALAEIHLEMAGRLALAPRELAERLARLTSDPLCQMHIDLESYAHLLDAQTLATLRG